MDAATRAELDALRERAYGPGADIRTDPAALARLEELERLARSARPAEPVGDEPEPRDDVSDRAPAQLDGAATKDPGAVAQADAPPSRRGRVIAFAGLALAAVVLAGIAITAALRGEPEPEPEASATPAAEAYTFGPTPGSVVLIRVPIDGSFGSFRNLPARESPAFPAVGQVLWAENLGDYYGFDLWIGGVNDGIQRQLCITAVVAGTDVAFGECAPRATWESGALFIAIPYTRILPSERPVDLNPSENLGFWWTPDDTVFILRGGSGVVRVDG